LHPEISKPNTWKRMKKLATLLFILAICATCAAQKNQKSIARQYYEKYSPQLDEGSTLLDARYYYCVEKTRDKRFVMKIFYPETMQMTHYMTYRDEKLTILDGVYKEWWDDGSIRFEGAYLDNLRSQFWIINDYGFSEKGNYNAGKPDGLWVAYDSINTTRKTWNYSDGVREGSYTKWDVDGKMIEEGIYQNDTIFQRTFYGEAQDSTTGGAELIMPSMVGCENADPALQKACSDQKMLAIIYRHIKYPRFAIEMDIQGKAIASFVIEKDGSLSDLVIRRGLCKEIGREVERVIRLLPTWNPGIQNGKPVRVAFNLPVSFKLE